MIGCLVTALVVILLFMIVPWPFWPFLIVGLVILFVIAAALGLFKGIVGTIFRR